MALAAIDTVVPDAPLSALPAHIELAASRSTAIFKLLLVAPMVAALALPFGLVAALAAEEPAAFAHLADKPLAVFKLILGLGLGAFIVVVPLRSVALRLGRRLSVCIDATQVAVVEQGLFGRSSWCTPLSGYAGLVHRVRTSLSGTQHEIILKHAQGRKSLILRQAANIGQLELERTASLLGLPVLRGIAS